MSVSERHGLQENLYLTGVRAICEKKQSNTNL